jgi:hypothetical protein
MKFELISENLQAFALRKSTSWSSTGSKFTRLVTCDRQHDRKLTKVMFRKRKRHRVICFVIKVRQLMGVIGGPW